MDKSLRFWNEEKIQKNIFVSKIFGILEIRCTFLLPVASMMLYLARENIVKKRFNFYKKYKFFRPVFASLPP